MLPAVAVLHVRHAPARTSGAVLATIAGTATVAAGLAGSVILDLRPAALLVLGIWWWTMGKMWIETALLPPAFGFATATLAVLAFAGGLVLTVSSELLVPGTVAAGQAWTIVQAVLGLWLLALAGILATRT
jgi:hypothetical protein